MADIALCTVNARYIHAGFGLRYLMANLGELRDRARLVELDINGKLVDMVAAVLDPAPAILGLGVYIWNVRECTALARMVKQLSPSTLIVIGGPEVSYEWEGTEIFRLCDYLIPGEADLAFAALCRSCLAGTRPEGKVIRAPLPPLAELAWPYALYTAEDILHRVVYVEASRGCPFSCEFCLSSLDAPVRAFETGPFLEQMEGLLARGARQFKFVDRTFNLNARTSAEILRFFLGRMAPGLFVHFEIVPDRLPEEVRSLLAQFPPGSLQLEAGIQTFDPATAARISRRQDYAKTEENLAWLLSATHAHIHADLIAGLPGETLESFGAGFDGLYRIGPHEIQVGILKKLKGTPIARHDEEWDMRYNAEPPYEILQTRSVPFASMLRARRFASYFDLYSNRGRFPRTARLIAGGADSPFREWMRFSDWLYARTGRTDSIALARLGGLLSEYLVSERGADPESVSGSLKADLAPARRPPPQAPARQQRHLAGEQGQESSP